ncbi:MAG TPA: tRNA (adenosine(37)-N6)-threonylcarbamoyltransferase complex ATPase subunit type 1 TsaE [Stellaceae bacterium]|nr:tRNA (adenosine(37)-N6)-threonylcarbamoyltransferase complex ATPase subunit type 1 TsaE [Stellaceae bacterium]
MATTSADTAVSLDLVTESETSALAARIARVARAGDVIALRGELGSGKTVFARGFIRARGRGDEEVPSPTFTLVEVYELADDRPAVWHFDLYRLSKSEDVYELGFEEALGGAILLIEWPERLGPLLPRERLDVELSAGSVPTARRARLVGSARWAHRLSDLVPR